MDFQLRCIICCGKKQQRTVLFIILFNNVTEKAGVKKSRFT